MHLPRLTSMGGLLLLLCACGDNRWLATDPELPDDVTWAAALVADPTGAPRGITPIALRSTDGRFELELSEAPLDDEQLVVVGWRSEQLEPLFPEPPVGVTDSPLRVAEAEDARLPTPAWSASTAWGMPDQLASIPTPAVAPLTASWLECPLVVSDGAYVGATCALNPCDGVLRQKGCEITVDTNACVLGELVMRVDDKGSITEVGAEQLSNCVSIPADPARFSVRCQATIGDCQVDVYDAPASMPEVSVDTLELSDGPPIRLAKAEKEEPGYLFGLATVKDRIVVAARDLAGNKGGACVGIDESRVVFVEPDALERVKTTTVAGCVIELVAELERDAVLVLHRQASSLWVTRLDAAGALVDSATIASSALARGVGMVLNGDSIFVLTSGDAYDRSTVLRIDAATYERRSRIELEMPGRRIQPYGDGVVVLTNDDLAYIDADDTVDVETYEASYGQGTEEGRLFCPPGSQECVVSGGAHERRTEVYVKSKGRDSEVTAFPNRLAQPYGLGPWPEAPWLSVGYMDASSAAQDAFLAVFNPTHLRWRAGQIPIGTGPVTDILNDSSGRIWAALPWSGTLVRVTPVP